MIRLKRYAVAMETTPFTLFDERKITSGLETNANEQKEFCCKKKRRNRKWKKKRSGDRERKN
jgi:hypothetical protein